MNKVDEDYINYRVERSVELFEDAFREDIFVKKVKYEYDFEELKVLINV